MNPARKKLKIYYKALGRLAFLLLLALLFAALLLPDRELSESEKRTLTQFPSVSPRRIARGGLAEDFEAYVSDQIPLRDLWIRWKVSLDRLFGKTESQGVYRGKDGFLIERMAPLDSGRLNDTLQKAVSFGEASGLPQTFVLVPNAVSVYAEKLPKAAVTESQENFAKLVSSSLQGSGIRFLDLSPLLLSHREDEALLYYRSDHHWTTYAAYLSAPPVLDALGKRFSGVWTPMTVTDDFVGSLAAKSGWPVQKPDSIQVYAPDREIFSLATANDPSGKTAGVYSRKGLESSDPYTVFTGGNTGHLRIETDAAGEGSLLVFKDSYFNCFLPFLLASFETIDVIDPRYYSGDLLTLLYQNDHDQVLYFYNMNTFSEDTSLSLVLGEYLSEKAAEEKEAPR